MDIEDYVNVQSADERDGIAPAPTGIVMMDGELPQLENKIEQEFHIVCASWGQPGHHEHSYVKGSYDLCVKYAAKLTKRTKGKEREWEIPFAIQTRVVSEWEYVPES